MRARNGRPRRERLLGLIGVSLILAACSSPAATTAPSAAAPTTPASAAAPSAAAPSASAEAKTLEIAYLSFAVANS